MAATSSSGSDREWRFQEERRYQIPASWADNGRHEAADDGEEQFYAVQIKLGIELQWTVDATGDPIDGPHRDRPVIRACYVSRDGSDAYVRDWDAVIEDSRATPERDFASVVAVDPADADRVESESNQECYRDVLQERYDVEPIVADGGQSTSGIEQSELRGEIEIKPHHIAKSKRCPECGERTTWVRCDGQWWCSNDHGPGLEGYIGTSTEQEGGGC